MTRPPGRPAPGEPEHRVLDALDGYVVHGPGVVQLSSGQALLDVLRMAEGAARRHRGDGLLVPARIAALVGVLSVALAEHRVITSALGTSVLPEDPGPASWESSELVGVAEAARLLGVSDRRVRAMAAGGQLAGRKRAGSWEIDRVDVERVARERRSAA